ncbi:MAG: UDP-N-acetylmuramate dehydrogenase [Opitutaceae bacterium]|nr:UDP-N-acetylmuramate dehydrogenase [Opitutaceae bacterium]
MGMAPLALALKAAGWTVSGEDKQWPEEVAVWLHAGGIERRATGDLPAATALVIFSSAVAPTHPTRAAALARGVPMMRRGLALACLVRGRPLIAICGSHGKTTTTAMLAWALRAAGVEADFLVGGLYAGATTAPAAWSGRGWVVAEIDESDGTIEHFSPAITLCVNVDWDHPDHYRERADIDRAFGALAERTGQAVFYCATCASSREVFAAGATRGAAVMSFGEGGDYTLLGTVDAAPAPGQTLRLGGRFGGAALEARLSVPGHFNAVNATAALAVAAYAGACDVTALLAAYPGVRRRQGVLLERGPLSVIEDYAHHPAEIEALLRAMRARTARRLVVIFQPHRHSRTAQFKDAFARVLATADRVWLLDVYSAGESPVPGGASSDVLAAMRVLAGAPEVELLADPAAAPEAIVAGLQRDDRVLFVGAGDIDAVARATVARLASVELPGWREALVARVRASLAPETILRVDEPLGAKTTMRVGGPAELYAEPASTADLQTLLAAARAMRVSVHLLGRGSNLIVPDDGVRGLVVRLQHPHFARFVCLGPGRYWAGAGLRLKELCGSAVRMGEGGFEFLEGIPGTVGGALRMNAGAMGGWMFDIVEQVHFLAPDGTLHIRRREQMHIEYRSCAELEGAIAIGAVLVARSREESAAIRARIVAYQEKRQLSQPREPSAGCVFKNPPGDSAGRIIDELGLKGLRIGDAEVSTVHGNFIINRGQATGSDVIALVRRVRDEVRARRHIELEPEVLLYGRTWNDVL